MKIKIPHKYSITNESINRLKLQVKKIINDFDKYNKKEYKIYLYSNFLKIQCKHRCFCVTIVEYNKEMFWYIKPFSDSYLLLKSPDDCFDLILEILQNFIP